MSLLWFLIIGAVAGWLAGVLMKGGGFGLIGNLLVGIIGSFIGGNLLGLLGITTGGLIGNLVAAVIGAVVLLYVVRLLKKA
ncbi:MAG: GlsB/YeaQ/YmgE family stress response membrane protein [Acidobacteriota bacterium]|nr:MAG: GlsB/YeaQ/YmgE family stress response membrane protein [Acidobacteriota bacterium]